MTRPRPTPIDAEYPVGVDELFFSTTDRRGVIRTGNSVFVRISRYSLEELIGSPHNLIRHPAMPGGVFALMWDRLLAGEPMAGYVQNMAADGATYWVFATITPFGDGFLSVRAKPLTPLFEIVHELYGTVRARELEYAANGHHSADVARYGAALIDDAVRRLGYPSYEAFMYEALAAEVAERRERHTGHHARPGATGSGAEVLAAATQMELALDSLTDRMARYGRLAEQLAPASNDLLGSIRELERVADHAEAVGDRTGVAVLRNIARVMREPLDEVIAAFTALSPQLGELLHMTRHERFAIGLARLHAEMSALFAAEAIDGLAPDGSLGEVQQLSSAMSTDVVDMMAGIDSLGAQLDAVSREIEAAAERNDRYSYFLSEWQRAAIRKATGTSLKPILEPAERYMVATREHLAALRELASECRANSDGIAPSAFQAPLDRIRQAVGYVPVN